MTGIKNDPIENTPQFLKVVEEVNAEVTTALKEQGLEKKLGYIHQFWALKKKILKEKYDIDWKSPREMNPQVIFD